MLLPTSFLFRFTLPVQRLAKLPKGGRLLNLSDEYALPLPDLDGDKPRTTLRAAWNADGLGFSVSVQGKRKPLAAPTPVPSMSDGLHLWIDTRNTQGIHRASRFCHRFFASPVGGGRNRNEPTLTTLAIERAREEPPKIDPKHLHVWGESTRTGWQLDVWIKAAALHGYEPEANPRLGFFYMLRDSELGSEYLSGGPEFPFALDPSLWWTLELQG
jgi:hypothetical protein